MAQIQIMTQPLEEKRRHARETDPVIFIEFEGKTFSTNSWSMGGFLIEDYKGQFSSGSLFTISGIGLSAKDLIAVNIRARVVRIEHGTRKFVVNYQDLDNSAYTFMKSLNTSAPA